MNISEDTISNWLTPPKKKSLLMKPMPTTFNPKKKVMREKSGVFCFQSFSDTIRNCF